MRHVREKATTSHGWQNVRRYCATSVGIEKNVVSNDIGAGEEMSAPEEERYYKGLFRSHSVDCRTLRPDA